MVNKIIDFLSTQRKQTIYYIKSEGGMGGFFAQLRGTLDYICYADELGMTPFVMYSNNLYSENQAVRGTKNGFEYYFKQIYEYNSILFPWNINVIKAMGKDSNEIELKYNKKQFSYVVEDAYIDKMAYIYAKYIRLSDYTERYIRHSVNKLLKYKKTLGIHIRGTDFNKSFNNHPIPISVDEYILYINKAVEEYGFGQVFVATDDKRCLEEIKSKLDVPIVYYNDVERSSTDKSVTFTHHDRKLDRYRLGLEVLRDAYTLVDCDGFIGCLSQVDTLVQIIRKSRNKPYQYMKIIDNGVYQNSKECWEPIR
jgi:hypothetical protein